MNLLRIFAVVITCLIVVGFGYPTHPTFPSYQTAVWHSSANTGYRCRAGICGYRCSSPWCHGFESALYPQMAMQEMWGSGAHGRHAHSRTMTEFLMKASPEDLTMLIESTPNIDEVITSLDSEAIIILINKLPNLRRVMEKLKPQTKMHIVSKLCDKVGNAMEWAGARRNDGSGMWNEYGSVWEGIDAIQDLEAEMITRCVQDCGYCAHPTMDGGYVFDPIPIKDVAVYDDSMNWQPQLPMPATLVSNMDPHVLRSIILNMPNLDDILMQVDPVHLQSALMYVPGFGTYASSMDAYTLHSMIVGLPYVRDIVASMDARLLQWMIAHIPNIDAILFGGNAVISQPTMPDMPRKAPKAEEPDAKTTEVAGGMSDEANIMDRKFMEYIISTMPNVPARFANVLLHVKPDYVRYIIENHGNLHGLLAKMNAQTLQYVIAHVPKFGVILSNMNRNTLKVVFDKLPNIAKFLADMNPNVVRAIVAKLPSLAKYTPTDPTTTALPTSVTLVPELGTEFSSYAPTASVTEASMVTVDYAHLLRSKIPLIDNVIKMSDPAKVAILRDNLLDVGTTDENGVSSITVEKLQMVLLKIPLFDQFLNWIDSKKLHALLQKIPTLLEVIATANQEALDKINLLLHDAIATMNTAKKLIVTSICRKLAEEGKLRLPRVCPSTST
uniref:ShKT domain-containing protein n=1 Tax=Echinococcus granulosus TaxID=6210 RepID=A0A068WVY6_ECHGR|nr:hypothetical protein EgrG_000081200 [Echinococcus granulosus]